MAAAVHRLAACRSPGTCRNPSPRLNRAPLPTPPVQRILLPFGRAQLRSRTVAVCAGSGSSMWRR